MLKKPFSPETMRPLACSALAMFLAMPVAVSATSFDLSVNTTTQQTLGNGESGNVQSGVTLNATPATSSVLVNGNAAGLTNQGYIGNSGASSHAAIRVDAAMSGAIVNSGYIYGPNGIDITTNGNVAGGITNSGGINSQFTGISVGGAMSGDIVNIVGGEISGNSSAISVGGTLSGDIVNSGNIYGFGGNGIDIGGTMTGDIVNSGSIYGYGRGDGIHIGGALSGNIVNNATGTINGSDAIYVSSDLNGNITNRGSIGGDYNGIYVDSIWTGNLDNSGTISANTSSTFVAAVNANTWNGSLSNSGSIDAHALSYSAAAFGVLANSMNGNLSNSGAISASATGTTSSARAIGVKLSNMSGNLSNSGSIDATADADYAYAVGVYINTLNNNLTNSGTLSASASGFSARGQGVNIGTLNNGNFTNSGTITAAAASGYSAYAAGVRIGSLTGDIVNSGTISSWASGPLASATGIRVGDMVGNLTNDGTILAGATGLSWWAQGVSISTLEGNLTNNGTIGSFSDAVLINDYLKGDIINNGKIIAGSDGIHFTYGAGTFTTASGTQSYALKGNLTNVGTITADSGTGVYINGNVFGDITNSGTITAGADGITVTGNMTGNITNSGTITGKNSDGINVFGDVNGDILNTASGVIRAASSSTAINVWGALNGTITNDGTITAGSYGIYIEDVATDSSVVNNSTISATQDGIYGYNVSGTITNNGSITAGSYGIYADTLEGAINNTASGVITAGTTGIVVTRMLAGSTITNDGTITGDYGIYTSDGTDGTIINNGTITAKYSGISITGNYAGETGTIVNNGTITTRPGDNAGIYVSGATGFSYAITNTGTIEALYGKAIWVEGTANGTIDQNAGTLIGNLNLGNGDDTVNLNGGTIVGSMDGNGQATADTLNVNTASYTLSGDISDFEAVNFNSGVTDLNGYNINNGTDVTVAGGATAIFRDSDVDADVANAGTVEVAGSNFVGNYTQAAGSTTQVDVVDSASAGNLYVIGDATLGNVVAHVTGKDYIANGSSYTVVQTEGTLDSTNLSVSDNSAVLAFTPTVTGTSLTLTADRVATYQSLVGGDLGLASQLDAIAASGNYTNEQAALLGALDSAPNAEALAKVLGDYSPDSTGAALEGSRGISDQVAGVVGERINTQLAQAGRSGLAAGDDALKSGVWVQGFSGKAKQDGSLGNSGYDAKNTGFVIGADTAVNSSTRVGISLASTKSNIDAANGAIGDSLDIKSNHVTVYGSYDAGSWTLAGMVAHSKHDYDSVRNATNTASYSGTQNTLKVEGGYPIMMSGIKVTPAVSLRYGKLDLDGYTETGAGALVVNSSSYTSNELGLGARVSKEIAGGSLTWVPRGSLFYRHEAGDVNQESSATLTSAGVSFSTASAERSRGTVELGLGVDMLSGDRIVVQADYQYESRSDYKANTARLTLRYKF